MKTSNVPAAPATASPLPSELQAAAALLAAGEHDAAIAQLRTLTGSQGQSPDLWRLLSDAVEARGGDPLPELLRWTEADPGNAIAHARLAQTLHDRGELAAAGAFYRQALAADPGYLDAMVQLGSVEQGMGNAATAVECYQLALRAAPSLHQLYPPLASALHALGRYEEATAAWSKALRLLGDEPVLHFARAQSLRASGRLGEALNASDRAVRLAPDDAAALEQLASLQSELGQFQASALHYAKSLLLAPDNAPAHVDFATVLHQLGLDDEALAHLLDALRIDPQSHLAAGTMGWLLIEQGRPADAIAYLRRAIAIEPHYSAALNNLGNALQTLGDNAGAAEQFRAAIAVNPSFIDAYRNLSIVLNRLGQHRESLENSVVAMALAPNDPDLLLNLANAQAAMGEPARSIGHLRKAARLSPKGANIRSNLAHFLAMTGETKEAVSMWREAIALDPWYAEAYSNLLFHLSHIDTDPTIAQGVRQAFAARFEQPASWATGPRANAEGPLRVGFVSGDFYQHAVAGFIEPALRELSRMPGLALYAYYNNTITDTKTATLQTLVPQWRNVHHLSDEALDATIRRDGIDILIDVSGHTAFNRLPVFARKPAPVQATWIGYPGSTGLRAMDYIIADETLLPPDQAASEFIEHPAYLSAAVTFEADPGAPDVSALPAAARGFVTFGSFNRANKIHRQTVALWARVLHGVPDARMFIAGTQLATDQPRISAWFAECGIGPERLRWAPRMSVAEYLALHREVDLCLDTTPYSGGTTTLNAAYMGVPTLTLAEKKMASRTSATLMTQLNLATWVTYSEDAYVSRAIALAADPADLALVRSTLRERLSNTLTGNPAQFGEAFARMLHVMWDRARSGLPAARIG